MNKTVHFDFQSMRSIDIHTVDPDTLVDIRATKVDTSKPLHERALDYISQIKNPYCFRCGKITVRLVYSETETTLEDCMEGYFRSL